MNIKKCVISSLVSGAFCLSSVIAPYTIFSICTINPDQTHPYLEAGAAYVYDTSDNYVADCLQRGIISLEDGSVSPLGNVVYKQSMEHEFTYDKLARIVMDDKQLQNLSFVWNSWNAVSSGEFSSLSETQVYEALIMDYLTYEVNSASYKSDIAQKTLKYEWKIYNELVDEVMKDDKTLTKEGASEIVRNSSIFKNNSENTIAAKKLSAVAEDMQVVEKLSDYLEIINAIEDIGSNANDYYQKLTKALAIQEANDKRVEFLLRMKEKASGNKPFCNAVDDVIAKMKASYASLSVSLGAEKMASYAVEEGWKLAIKQVPCFSALELGTGGLDVLFNSSDLAANNIKLILLYTMEQYAKQAVYSASRIYADSRTQENATTYIDSFRQYLKYQEYATDWGRTFVSDILFEGIFNAISNIFPNENQQTYDAYMEMYDYDISLCEKWDDFVNQWYALYNNYVGVSELPQTLNQTMSLSIVNLQNKSNVKISSNELKNGLTIPLTVKLDGLLEKGSTISLALTVNSDDSSANEIKFNNNKLTDVTAARGTGLTNVVENHIFAAQNSCVCMMWISPEDDTYFVSGNLKILAFDVQLPADLEPGNYSVTFLEYHDDRGLISGTKIVAPYKEYTFEDGLGASCFKFTVVDSSKKNTETTEFTATATTKVTTAAYITESTKATSIEATTVSITAVSSTEATIASTTEAPSTNVTAVGTTETTFTDVIKVGTTVATIATTEATNTTEATTSATNGAATTTEAMTNITTAPTEPTKPEEWYASIAVFNTMVKKHYEVLHENADVKTNAKIASDGTIQITITDQNDEILDVYTIDPKTGIGTNREAEEINLPQTGATSKSTVAAVGGAFMMIAAGFWTTVKSLRKKKYE